MVTPEQIQQASDHWAARFHPDHIIVFGSHARGTADAPSDVDFLVVGPLMGSRRRLMVALDRALRGFGFARDIVVLSPEEFERDCRIAGTIARPACQEGKVWYAKR